MKFKVVFFVLMVVSLLVLAGCKQAEPALTEDTSAVGASESSGGDGQSTRGLTGMNLLSFGTLELEGTENAVTPEQAVKLLPLWQMIQGGSLQSAAEIDAVVKQIEGLMTDAQMAAIDAMGLTFDDYQAWMDDQGIEMPAPAAGQGGGPGNLQNLTEEERTKMREQFQGMSPEERATAMAEMGIQKPEGSPGGGFGGGSGFGGGARGGNPTLVPLIELLTARAAQ